jgi:hypothetical protein
MKRWKDEKIERWKSEKMEKWKHEKMKKWLMNRRDEKLKISNSGESQNEKISD